MAPKKRPSFSKTLDGKRTRIEEWLGSPEAKCELPEDVQTSIMMMADWMSGCPEGYDLSYACVLFESSYISK